MKSEIVTYDKYKIKVVEADAETGMLRTILQEDAIAQENVAGGSNPDIRAVSRRILHTILYPAMIAASEPIKGFESWPISFDEYRKLPEQLVILWEEKVFGLNKHWQPVNNVDTGEQEKKVPNSSPKS